MKLSLVRRKSSVLAHLLEKFAVSTAETMGTSPACKEHAENLALDQKRRDHQRTLRQDLPDSFGQFTFGLTASFSPRAFTLVLAKHSVPVIENCGWGDWRG